MSVFALPALIALFTKILVYVFAKKTKHTSQTFLWLLVFFALHNLSEFFVISQLANNETAEGWFLRLYYVALLFSLAYMCIFSTSVVNSTIHKKHIIIPLSIASSLSLIFLLTDWVLAGSVSIGYTMTAVKGPYYFVFQLSVLSGFAFILYTLVKRYLNTLDLHVQMKCFYAVFSLSPIIIMSLFVMAMMQIGYQYTGAILLPFSSTFVLVILVLTEKNHDLIRIRGKLPFSNQRRAEKKLTSIYRSHICGDLGLHETKNEIEKILIQNALDYSDGNVTLAANTLGIKRSSLYSIFNRLEMRKHIEND